MVRQRTSRSELIGGRWECAVLRCTTLSIGATLCGCLVIIGQSFVYVRHPSMKSLMIDLGTAGRRNKDMGYSAAERLGMLPSAVGTITSLAYEYTLWSK